MKAITVNSVSVRNLPCSNTSKFDSRRFNENTRKNASKIETSRKIEQLVKLNAANRIR